LKKIILLTVTLIFIFVSGCTPPPGGQAVKENNSPQPRRFEIIQEEGETQNIGGFTVIKDNQTGKEYLVITGLNGAPTVINLQ
jgi:hypothetical protein